VLQASYYINKLIKIKYFMNKRTALWVVLAVVVAGGTLYGFARWQSLKELAIISCIPGEFCGGSISPSSVPAGGAYTMSCNYGYSGNGIHPTPGSGSCTYKKFSGTTAEFNCVAGSVPGIFTNTCAIDNGSSYAAKTNKIDVLTVQCAAGQFCGGSATPASVAPGGKYTISCNYGYSGNGVTPVPGSGSCTYQGFSGNTAQFNCTAGSATGVFNNSCALNSGSPYSPTTKTINALTVVASSTGTGTSTTPLIPANAISSGDLDGSSLWKWVHDAGTTGDSVGASTYPLTLGGYSDVRGYTVSNYLNYGGERYSIDFGKDTASTHFIYDLYVQSPSPSVIRNLELDMNQVTANGDTVILGFQCDSGANAWDYSKVINPNTPTQGTKWVSSAVPCNVSSWTPNTWYHIQISTQRDNSGNVTYNWVAVNGVVSQINATVFSKESLRWAVGAMVVNFQLDPLSKSGTPMIAYVHNLTIYRW
jgi:hypothetical protein